MVWYGTIPYSTRKRYEMHRGKILMVSAFQQNLANIFSSPCPHRSHQRTGTLLKFRKFRRWFTCSMAENFSGEALKFEVILLYIYSFIVPLAESSYCFRLGQGLSTVQESSSISFNCATFRGINTNVYACWNSR